MDHVPPGRASDTLPYQLLHLRLAMDELAVQALADNPPGGDAAQRLDALAVLQMRRQLRGRDRHPVLPLPPAPPAAAAAQP